MSSKVDLEFRASIESFLEELHELLESGLVRFDYGSTLIVNGQRWVIKAASPDLIRLVATGEEVSYEAIYKKGKLVINQLN